MPISSTAVFLSYASEDSEAAQRIADALRASAIEVWFDKSELRGGDAWDRNIRDQIHRCQLFLPIISAHSEARDEGYFRREWALAEDRTRDMAHNRAFLLPVVIDGTPERGALVPEKFLDVQWTRLPAGNTDAAFVERVKRLLAAEVIRLPPPTAPAGDRVAPMTSPRAPRRRGLAIGAVAAALAILLIAYIAYERRGAPAPNSQAANSIAVLPLANESGDPSQQYFSDGLSENLITALTQFPGLKVIGRTSAFQFRDSKEDAHSIGGKLGVARLLEGSVQRSGEMVRVSTALIDTSDGSTQWSERYDRPYKDLFALQDEITRAVAGALRARLLPGQHAVAQDERPPSGNLEAYNAMLQGKFYFARSTEADFRRAIAFQLRATQLDPNYAFAWSELSHAWSQLGITYLVGAPLREASQQARAAADRAIALSPDLAAAHTARGVVSLFLDFDWRASETEFSRALNLAPNDGSALYWYATQMVTFGDVHRAIDLTRKALAIEPLQAEWYRWLAWYLSALNRHDQAVWAARRAIELQPTATRYYRMLASVEVNRGHAEEALAAAQQAPVGYYRDGTLALARQIGGDQKAADEALKVFVDKDGTIAPYQIAQVYALRHDANATFSWLDRAWSNRDADIINLLSDPFILRLKNDPRFAAFCRKIGLPVPGEKLTTSER